MNTLAKLEKRFLPYCDHEYANRQDNAANCADVADKYAIEFIKWVFENTQEFDDLVVNCFQNCILAYNSQQFKILQFLGISCELLSKLYFSL